MDWGNALVRVPRSADRAGALTENGTENGGFRLSFSQVVKVLFKLVETKSLRNLKLRSALLWVGLISLYIAFYPPTTTLLNFRTYLTCYVPDNTPVLCDCKSCSANCFSLRKFE